MNGLNMRTFYSFPWYTSLLLFFAMSPGAAQTIFSLTVEDAVKLAIENNPDLAISEYQAASAEYAIREAKGNFLPKLSLNGSYTRNIDKPVIFLPETFGWGRATEIGLDNNFTTWLDLSVPLYSRLNSTTRKVAYRNFHLQQEMLTSARQNVIASVRKGYFSYLIALEVVRVREKALMNSIENLNTIRDKLSQGVATGFDETSAQVKVATAQNNLLEAQSQLTPAGDNLKLLLGLPFEVSFVLKDSIALTAEELAFPEDPSGLVNNSAQRQEELRLEIAKAQTHGIRASYYPLLNGVGTYQYQTQDNDLNFSSYDWIQTSSLGLKLLVPLFSGTVTRHRVQQYTVSEKIAEARMEYTSRYNQAQFQKLVSALNFIRQRMAVQADNIALAAKALELVKVRYSYGKASVLEVNNAELDHTTAKLAYLQALADYKSTFCDLELLTGEIK